MVKSLHGKLFRGVHYQALIRQSKEGVVRRRFEHGHKIFLEFGHGLVHGYGQRHILRIWAISTFGIFSNNLFGGAINLVSKLPSILFEQTKNFVQPY